jgi:hypothetical protein
MEWAVWDKGRRFVQKEGSPFIRSATPIDKTTPVTVVDTTPVLGTSLGMEKTKKSSSSTGDLNSILEALGQQVIVVEEQAALQYVNSRRIFCPDASTNEIGSTIHEECGVTWDKGRRSVQQDGSPLANPPEVVDRKMSINPAVGKTTHPLASSL